MGARVAHYINGPDAPEPIQCPRCRQYRQPNGWTTVAGQRVPWNINRVERPFELPGYGPAWLCHDCAGAALAAVLAHLDALTEAQVLDMLSGLGDGVALEQAMQAAGLPLEETP